MKYRDPRSETYEQRKLEGKCTYSARCDLEIVDGRQMCAVHLERARKSTAASLQRTRNARREVGLCAYCGKVKSAEYACLRCRIVRGLFSSENDNSDVNVGVDDPRFRVHDDGRRRFHGQMKRGRQPVSQLDDQDLESAMEQIKKARAELARANSAPADYWPRHERENAKRAALAMAEHATRFVDEVLERHQFSAGAELRMTRMTVGENRRRGGR